MSIDRMSNILSSLKNASMAGKPSIEVAYSKKLEAICNILKDRGFLSEVKVFKNSGESFRMLHLELAVKDGVFQLTDTKQISKPGRKIYRKAKEFRRVAGGFGVQIVSTPKGIMDSMVAKKKNLGGEVLCEVL